MLCCGVGYGQAQEVAGTLRLDHTLWPLDKVNHEDQELTGLRHNRACENAHVVVI